MRHKSAVVQMLLAGVLLLVVVVAESASVSNLLLTPVVPSPVDLLVEDVFAEPTSGSTDSDDTDA